MNNEKYFQTQKGLVLKKHKDSLHQSYWQKTAHRNLRKHRGKLNCPTSVLSIQLIGFEYFQAIAVLRLQRGRRWSGKGEQLRDVGEEEPSGSQHAAAGEPVR